MRPRAQRGVSSGRVMSLALWPLLALGCTSGPTGGQPGGSGGDASGATATVAAGTGGSTPGVGGSVAVVDAPSAAYVRRLTHIEYDNTIVDLSGVAAKQSATFETDLAQDGFTNNSAGQNVSPTLAEQYMVASEAISEAATANLTRLLGCDPTAMGEAACIQQFITTFGKRVWRRPLSAEETTRLSQVFGTVRAEFDVKASVQLLIQVFLQSPQFVYLLEPNPAGVPFGQTNPLGPWQIATRLSYFLLGSMPDAALFQAAETGVLSTAEGVTAEAKRLLSLPRARQRIGLFFEEWLRLRNIARMQKDATMFPNYSLAVAPLMLEQVQRFTESIILDDNGTATDLLTASYSFVAPELASMYDVTLPPGTANGQFVRVDFDPRQRSGLLTHVGVLAKLAHINQTDPVHRGKFVRTGLLCDAIAPPPQGLVINIPEVTPGTTTRERFRLHQEDPTCAGCHLLMDPIGLGFERYDALGQWRDLDNGMPIDATGEVIGSDVGGPFDGAQKLAQKLAQSEQVMECMARTWLRFALGRSDLDDDAGAVTVAGGKFKESGFVMKELLVALTSTNTFRYQRVLDPNTSVLQPVMP
jgi:hypothetical protein